MRSRLYRLGWKILDILFPPSCAGCGNWGERYCARCFEKTQLMQGPICQICGDTLHKSGEVICRRCRTTEVAFSAVRSWALFTDPLQSAIHKLKYSQDRGLGEVLARPMIQLVEEHLWSIDLIVPVPLDSSRRRERGYNQAGLLARPISWQTGIGYSNAAVKRVKITRQQVGLKLSERAENMAGAFLADQNLVANQTILLIDDVITTGSTLNACAKAIIQAGAKRVYGVTLARSAHL